MTKTVVLGIGNTLLSDEGVGVHVMQRLQAEHPELAVEFIDGGTLSFTLAGPIAEAAQLIVVDAAELQSPPGSVRVFEDEAMDTHIAHGKRRSVHEVGLGDLLAISRLSGQLPERRALVGIQPRSLGWGEAPSAEVDAAIPHACARVLELLERWEA